MFDVPLLTDVVAEAMRTSLDKFAGSDSYDRMILAHTTAQHELLKMPLKWFCVDGEFKDQLALQQLIDELDQLYDEQLVVDITTGLVDAISALCAEAIYFSEDVTSTVASDVTEVSICVPSSKRIRTCLQNSLQFMMRKQIVYRLSDSIRSKFMQLTGVTRSTDLGVIVDQWVSDLETNFELSSRMKARLKVCIAILVEDSTDHTS